MIALQRVGNVVLSADNILIGAYFAMEQAGRLLEDSCLLYQHRRLPSSVVLAVFSLEESGKAQMLLEWAIKSATEGPIGAKVVKGSVSDHQAKLRSGRDPASILASVGKWGNADEWAELERQLAEKHRIALRDAPKRDHVGRLRALFVDFEDNRWRRPAEITVSDAFLKAMSAAIQYGNGRQRFIKPADPSVAEALERMATVLLPLPEPRYPTL